MNHLDKSEAGLIDSFKLREEIVLHTDFSQSPILLDDFLHPDLFEISPIGTYTSRSEIVAWLLAKSPMQRWCLTHFKVVELATDTMLVCYQANSINDGKVKETGSLRSSIWHFNNQKWRLRFHQATKN
ncbi:Putative uncharacterized protein [Moritella viscosa]|uniref:DUF4440 domain-containing protein n=1 Tax=Moritella viscosa TaxID=80854 RepID=A0A090IDF8_9GAMM|nr:DUF4440 domain-containing protein [Moritella viscosa]CED60320.1 putative uncharacterized protein [Moritella viscosa]SGZ05324.1 Putative uncharacterized protein [Moritella viscosa]SGZ12025.1 Putative uncharacterized protein [Moritella viscosa]SHO12629.1 Putative uncharacterized protein [Moritella viscosa]SHO12630.1 Putative uncharacterized protein [Moritella viscosa]